MAVAAICLTISSWSHASVAIIQTWHEQAFRAAFSERDLTFPELSNILAMMSVAMFDAANAIEPKYVPYSYRRASPPNASVEAAVHSAAYRVLLRNFPSQSALIANTYRVALDGIPEGLRRDDGIAVGFAVAESTLRESAAATTKRDLAWAPQIQAGVYVPTAEVVTPHLHRKSPWALQAAAQFRPPPPPATDSSAFFAALNEVSEIGSFDSSARTKEQTDAGKFWALSGVHAWNRALVQMPDLHSLSIVDALRVNALLNIALSDSYVATWEAKYHYLFWRPLTAVNSSLARSGLVNTYWRSLLATPMHPEYPSGHSANAGVALEIFGQFLKNQPRRPIIVASENPTGPKRSFATIDDMAHDVSNSRVWAGVHYRFSCDVGVELGRNVARYAISTRFLPK